MRKNIFLKVEFSDKLIMKILSYHQEAKVTDDRLQSKVTDNQL